MDETEARPADDFVSGGSTGQAYVYGAEVATSQLITGPAFFNDAIVTRNAAYFTNSSAAEIYRLPLESGSPSGAVETIPLSGDWQQVAGFNANGIDATPDGTTLFVVNTTTGTLYRIDPRTGVADTTIAALGSRLYAVNARFATPPTPDTSYDIVKVDGS